MAELIKVHVTAEQREELEFLVARRMNDIAMDAQRRRNSELYTKEYDLLETIKTELQQAGT